MKYIILSIFLVGCANGITPQNQPPFGVHKRNVCLLTLYADYEHNFCWGNHRNTNSESSIPIPCDIVKQCEIILK
jgi:hypothetical protein